MQTYSTEPSKMKWIWLQWAELVVDGAQDGAKAKDGAVA